MCRQPGEFSFASISLYFSIVCKCNFLLERRDVLVTAQDVVRVIFLLKLLQTTECVSSKRSAHALDRLIGLHIVDIATAIEGPRLDSRRGLTRPGDLFSVKRRVLPDWHY